MSSTDDAIPLLTACLPRENSAAQRAGGCETGPESDPVKYRG